MTSSQRAFDWRGPVPVRRNAQGHALLVVTRTLQLPEDDAPALRLFLPAAPEARCV